jgi:hypothetical protein
MKKFGLYSATAAQKTGTVKWRTPQGDVIEVTCVTPDPSRYVWKDAVNLGEVTEYVSGA